MQGVNTTQHILQMGQVSIKGFLTRYIWHEHDIDTNICQV